MASLGISLGLGFTCLNRKCINGGTGEMIMIVNNNTYYNDNTTKKLIVSNHE